MEMYNEDTPAHTSLFQGTNVPVDPPSFDQQPVLTHKRRVILIFTGINLVLCLINFLFVLHSYAASESLETQAPSSSTQLSSVIIALIYYGFGLLVAYRYYQTGLLAYAALGLVALNLIIAVIVVLLIRIVHKANREGFVNAGLIVAIIFVAVYCLVFIIQIFIVFYAFNLYRSLKRNSRSTIEQI